MSCSSPCMVDLMSLDPSASAGRVHILHTPVWRNGPALDRVHVIEQRTGFERATLGDELRMGRLRIPRLVSRAALEHSGRAVPDPGKTKSRLADRQHRLLQRGDAPGLAAVGGDFHAGDLAAPRPRKAGDLI